MPETKDYYLGLIREMIDDDKDRDKLVQKVDEIFYMDWKIDEDFRKLGVREMIDSSGHDVVNQAAAIYSKSMPMITISPLSSAKLTPERINDIETWLRATLELAWMRQNNNGLRSLVQSVFLYDEIITQVNFLPWQIEAWKSFGRDVRSMQETLRYGNFSLPVLHPANVHARYSDNMAERLVTVRVDKIDNLVARYGETLMKPLTDSVGWQKRPANNKLNAGMRYATLYDYIDREAHVMLATPSSTFSAANVNSGLVLMNQKRKEPFLPYASRIGGGPPMRSGKVQRLPMLYPIVETGMWEDVNLLDSLNFWDATKRMGAQRYWYEGVGGEKVFIKYFTHEDILRMPPGTVLNELPVPPIDQNIEYLISKLRARMEASSMSNVLRGYEPQSGVAYASINLAAASAVKRIGPMVRLAENAIADICRVMLEWHAFTGTPLWMPGMEEVILAQDIPVQTLYIDVKLAEEDALDKTSKMNQALMAYREGLVDRRGAIELSGETNPDSVVNKVRSDSFENAAMEAEVASFAANQQLINQMKAGGFPIMAQRLAAGDPVAMQIFQMMEQVAAQATQQPELAGQQNGRGPVEQGTPANPENELQDMRGAMMEGREGPLFNRAEGGITSEGSDGLDTFEGRTGTDRAGNEIL